MTQPSAATPDPLLPPARSARSPAGLFRGARVAVIYGGPSSERAVSLQSGGRVLSALHGLG